MQRTKSKILSILLSLVMLLSLLPTTALAANYDSVEVNGIKLENGHYLENNSSAVAGTGATTDAPTTYVAWYKDGVLTLNGYNGKGIATQGVAAGELTVKLIGTNSINDGVIVSDNGGDITVTSDSSGTLSISKTTSGSNPAIGIETGLSSSYSTGNVTITGNAQVTITMKQNGTSGSEKAYGIFAKENITISENASVDITCATPNNATGGSNCNGMFANGNVSINTEGTIKINVKEAGSDSAYSFGIYPMGTATLTKVGNMEVWWKSHDHNTSYPGGAVYNKGTSLSDKDYAINEDETNCYASYRKGTPYTVTVEEGTLTGPGVKYPNGSGKFLAGDTVEIKPSVMKGKSGEVIPFKEWTSSDVAFTSSATTESNSFIVPAKNVTVTAKHNPFVGAPTFTPIGTISTEGTLTFKTKVTLGDGNESFALVKEAEVDDMTKYKSINPSTTSPSSPYEYSCTVNFNNFLAGNYYVAEKLNGAWYLSEKFTVNYNAASAGNYPDSVRVYNASGNIKSLSDGKRLAANDAGSATPYSSGDPYVARYEKSSGTLYLNGYQVDVTDGKIYASGDLNIVVESNSSFTTSTTATGDLYGIQADGKLNISGSGKLTVTAKGDGNVYGIYANKGVTISAPLDVQVRKVDSTKNGPLYGIYTQSGAISLSDKDKTITATGGTENVYGVYNAADTSTTITDNGNIGISGKLTVDLRNGSNNRGISSQGGVITLDGATVKIPSSYGAIPCSYHYGIFNLNGNVVIKSTPDVELTPTTSSGEGICTYDGGDLTIENSTVKVSANGLAASLKGNVSIKDSTVELTLIANHNEVIRTGNSSAANTIDLSGSGSVTLTASGNQTNAMISGPVSLGTNTKLEKGKEDGTTYDGEYDGSSKTVLQFVHEAPAPAANISLSQTSTVDFGSMEASYSAAPTAKTVTITNNGTAATGALTIALDGANKTDFTLSKTSITDIASGGGTDTFTVQPKTGLSAGIYTATVKVSGTGAGVTEQRFDVKFTVTAPATPITDSLVTVSDLTGKKYNESAQEPTFGGTLTRDTDYTVSYAVKSSSTGTLNGDGKPVGAGTYDVIVAGKGSYTGSFTKDFEIGKATPVYTAPTAKTGLAYTGSALELITAGSVSKGGEMQYNQGSGSYSTTIPTATDAGDYTVHFKIVENNNYNAVAETQVGSGAINIAPADQNAPTTLGVTAPTTSSGNGKITGTTDKMEYNTNAAATSGWTACSTTETEVAPDTYYVRYKADANHNAGTAATVTVPAYGATKYTVTVTYDANGTASADKTTDVVAGETVTLTVNPNSGYVFDKWDDKTPAGLTIGTDGKFNMPSENVSVKATFKPADLTGTASITGELKYGAELTAKLTGSNNTGNLHYKWYQNGTTQIAANNTGKYTLRADDIGKTITVEITSDVQTGKITSAATAAVDRADGPTAPSAFTLTFTLNADGTTFTATIPTVAGGEYSFDGTNYSATNSKTDCAANTVCTGYVRIAATPTHKASAATNSTQTSPKLTVATPTFTPNGASFTGTQSVDISCTTAGAKIYYTTDGTEPTASSHVYSTALSLTSTTTVKAIAVKAGMNNSAIATATFTKYSGGGGGGSYTPSYTVSVDKTENGTITVSPKSASKGDTVTITVKPDKGYELDALKVLDKNGDKVKLTEKNGKYTFTMPTGKVTVKGSFVEEAPVQIFKDVPVDAYYYEAVKWAAEKGITGGVGNGLFAPNQPCTRAQIVTFLWRAAGSPAPKNMSSFADVPADAFYAKAVAWAVENGITGGTGDGKFSPDATCTRAQSVTFLYRAAGSPKVSGSAEFGDVATNAYYADAVAWAAKNGITGGIGGGLFGSDNDCTRAQIVTFLYRSVK